MLSHNSKLVSDVRVASRNLVRQFGLMNQGVAGTDMSLSAVHAIIETGRAGRITARELCDQLLLEKSTVSRMVKMLVSRGEFTETRSREDLRVKYLKLTPQGKKTLRTIDQYAETQVSGALSCLEKPDRFKVLEGIENYAAALHSFAVEKEPSIIKRQTQINSGYTPTLVARTVEMLHGYMHSNFGFGASFESRIASDMAEFISRIESSCNQVWYANDNGRIIGSISIDGEDLEPGLAHLRWFTVSGEIRGKGIGNDLLNRAIRFCDEQAFDEIQLWTVKGLDTARRLYEKHGFSLAEEYEGDQWGSRVTEQKFVRVRP